MAEETGLSNREQGFKSPQDRQSGVASCVGVLGAGIRARSFKPLIYAGSIPVADAKLSRVSLMPLETEVAVFEKHRLEWCYSHRGRFAVIQDETVLGFFDEWEQGLKAGFKAFGCSRPFLVKQVFAVEPVYLI